MQTETLDLPISHRSVVEEVVAELEKRISTGVIRPGQRIIEEHITARWAVSRSTLREAFRILEGQGFVSHIPRRGVFVTEINPVIVREVYAVRAALESLAMREAVANATAEDIADLKTRTAAMRLAAEQDDMQRYLEMDQAIHEQLIRLSGNTYLFSVLLPINKLVKRYRSYIFYDTGDYSASLESHEEILGYFDAGDPQTAAAMRRKRILANGEKIARQLEITVNHHQEAPSE